MNLFLSYARQDQQKAQALASLLTELGQNVWLDRKLTGGQPWWDHILRQIEQVDAIVVLISPASQHSQACGAERVYAMALGKAVLPVLVETVAHETLPADLQMLQIIDYRQRSEEAAIQLARAIGILRPAPPLPDPLPPPPPVPLSYLSGIGHRLVAPTLGLEEQVAIASQLETAMRAADLDERSTAQELLRVLSQRPDLYAETHLRISRLISIPQQVPRRPPPVAPPPPLAGRPPIPQPPPAQGVPAATQGGMSTGNKALMWSAIILILLCLCTSLAGALLESGSGY
jgi:hypothetical protein